MGGSDLVYMAVEQGRYAPRHTDQNKHVACFALGRARVSEIVSATRMPHLSALWSTDAKGVCVSSQEIPEGLVPAIKGVTLGAWLGSVQVHDDAMIARELAVALEAAAPFKIELSIHCRDGTTRRVICSGLPQRHPDTSSVQYNGSIVDITEQRKAMEDALRIAAEYRLMVENTTDLIAHCDLDGRYVSISPSYSRMIGWSADEMIGQQVVDFLHPEDREPANDALLHILNGGVLPDVVEVRKRHRDGSFITLGTKACCVKDPYTGQSIGAVLVSRDITRDKQKIRRLEKRASYDALTGLSNRASISSEINALLARQEGPDCIAVLFIDLNGFKAVNDSMGHAAGDSLLKEVGKRFKRCTRTSELIGRLGGDEFIVAAKCKDGTAAAQIAQRLLDSLNPPFVINGAELRIGASIGISMAECGAASAKQLFEKADIAMYQAKARRDGSYQFFEQAPVTG